MLNLNGLDDYIDNINKGGQGSEKGSFTVPHNTNYGASPITRGTLTGFSNIQ